MNKIFVNVKSMKNDKVEVRVKKRVKVRKIEIVKNEERKRKNNTNK